MEGITTSLLPPFDPAKYMYFGGGKKIEIKIFHEKKIDTVIRERCNRYAPWFIQM